MGLAGRLGEWRCPLFRGFLARVGCFRASTAYLSGWVTGLSCASRYTGVTVLVLARPVGPWCLGRHPMTVNRSEASRALAKAIAYADCGKPVEAAAWARTLVTLLGSAGILRDAS